MSYLGENVPKLGFGLMRLPRKDGAIDLAQVSAMADEFLDAGFTYFDTAWGYPDSEQAFGDAVASRHSRESYLLATKCPAWLAKNKEEAQQMIYTSLKRTRAEYFDFYLLHNLGGTRSHCFDDFDIWNYAQRKKQEGLVKHVGFSFHDSAAELDKLLCAHPEVEFVQLQLNYADWENAAVESRKCYETALAHGKPVVIMEPVKGGLLAKLPAQAEEIFKTAEPNASLASWAVRYAASLKNVVTVLSGMSSLEQMKDNLKTMKNFAPLSPREREAVVSVAKIIEKQRTIPCSSCKYCQEVCPQHVAIAGIFDAANIFEMFGNKDFAQGRYDWNTDMQKLARANKCVKCGKCEQACPQHIKIRDELASASLLFDKK